MIYPVLIFMTIVAVVQLLMRSIVANEYGPEVPNEKE